MVEQLFLESSNLSLIVFELVTKSFIIVFVSYTNFFVDILDMPCSNYKNKGFFKFAQVALKIPQTFQPFLLLLLVSDIKFVLGPNVLHCLQISFSFDRTYLLLLALG